MSNPRLAYVLLWYPKPSETFLLSEVRGLRGMGIPLRVFTLYACLRGLPPELRVEPDVERLGLHALPRLLIDLGRWLLRKPRVSLGLLCQALAAGLGGAPGDRGELTSRLEKYGENLWGTLCAFHLARRFEQTGMEHIHAPWACGPATAAWVASRLTGIPFSFAGRAHDIHPPDGLLGTKLRAAAFVRVIVQCNARPLEELGGLPAGAVRLIHEILPWSQCPSAPVRFTPPLRLLGLGRFVPKKGFDDLLAACALLAARGIDFRLTLAGDGPEGAGLRALAKRIGIAGRIEFTGFVTHAKAARLLHGADMLIAPCRVEPSGDRDGLPMVLIEALLHRVPVVTTDVAGITELVEHGVTGVVVPQHAPEGLADAIEKLAENRARAISLAEAGKRRALALCSTESNLGQLAAFLWSYSLPTPPDRDL